MVVFKALAKRKHLLFALPALILIFGLTFTTYNVKGLTLSPRIVKAITIRAYCSGSECDNQNPDWTMNANGAPCDSNPYTVTWTRFYEYNIITAGQLDMRWSYPCDTNWTRLTSYSTDNSLGQGQLYYIPGSCGNHYDVFYHGNATYTIWTNQQYAPGTTPVESAGFFSGVVNGNVYNDYQTVQNPNWGTTC